MIERTRLTKTMEGAFDAHVDMLFANYALGAASDATALTHFETGLRAALKCREHALNVINEMTPNG